MNSFYVSFHIFLLGHQENPFLQKIVWLLDIFVFIKKTLVQNEE